MWRTTPANPPRGRGVNGANGGRRQRHSGSISGPSSPVSFASLSSPSRPPRLAPLAHTPAARSSYVSSSLESGGATPSAAVLDGERARTSAVLTGSPGASGRFSVGPAPPGAALMRLPPPMLRMSGSDTASSSTARLRTSGALWQLRGSRPPPQQLTALTVGRPAPNAMSWRRSKPLTRQLTTTVTATAALPRTGRGRGHGGGRRTQGTSRRQSKEEEGQMPVVAPPLPPSPPPLSAVPLSAIKPNVSREVEASVLVGFNRAPRSSVAVACQEARAAAAAAALTISESSVAPSTAPTDANGVAGSAHPLAAPESSTIMSPPTTETSPASSPSSPFLLFHADAPQSDYAQTHQLPRLFAEMVTDLANAEPQTRAPTVDENVAEGEISSTLMVEQWIQHWFRTRYDRCGGSGGHALPASASSPFLKRARRGPRRPSGAGFVVRVCSGDRRTSELPSASPSPTATLKEEGKTSSPVSSSLSHRFVPLTGVGATTTTTTAAAALSAAAGLGEEGILSASLDSAANASGGDNVFSHFPAPPPPPPPPPHRVASSSSTSSSQRPSAALSVPPRASKSTSPPNSAGANGSERPPRPTSHQSLSGCVAKTSGTINTNTTTTTGGGNSGSAAVAREGRVPATLTCAVEGVQFLISGPEAAPPHT